MGTTDTHESQNGRPCFCDDCVNARLAKAAKERNERVSALDGLTPMDWDQWVDWLALYGFCVGNDFAFALGLYAEHGCELPFDANLTDFPQLEYAVTGRVVNFPELHPELVSDALAEAMCDKYQIYYWGNVDVSPFKA